MKKLNKKVIALWLILLLAAFLRFWQLGKVPASPDWDEAALGYNAYSLLQTGQDEYGKFLPLILRSFDDYKPAIYAYLAILPVKFFGLNVWAVRLPAAIIGTLAVLFVYLLVKELFRDSVFGSELSLLAAFLLAISPWHLQFSRVAFETAVGMALNIWIAWLFLKGLHQPRFLSLAAFFAGLNIYVYQAEKIFTPLLILTMIFIWRKQIFNLPRRFLVTAIFTGLIIILPFVKLTFTSPEIFLRAKGTSFASDQTQFLSRTAQKLLRDSEAKDYLGIIVDNRRITYLFSFISGYLSHFDLNWLLITGDEARHHAPGMGLLYLAELPFFLYGIYKLTFERKNLQAKYFIFSWFFLAPLPAAFTSGVPHAVRALRFLPMVQIFSAFGVISFWLAIYRQRTRIKLMLFFGILGFFIFNFIYYLNQYFVQLNYFTSQSWQYGYQQAVAEIQKIEDKYERIIVSNKPHLDQSYMFFLFYLKYNPKSYQERGGTVSGGFAEDRNSFDKYVFRPINWEQEEKNPRILYVGRPDDFSVGASIHKTINFIDGKPAILIVKGK